MNKVLLILALFVVASLLISCVPTEPQDMLPYCKDKYEQLKAGTFPGQTTAYPDLPPAYIGACVSNMQSGKPSAFASLCDYEPFKNEIEYVYKITVDTRQECINFLQHYEEYTPN